MDNVEPVCMPYKLLSEITDGFSDKRVVGRGTFGVVYKGEDKDAQVIAVKVLKFFEGVNDDDFHREFNNLAKLRHENIVRLLGFCNETENVVVEHNGKQVCAEKVYRALCFEYMQNGSLHKHLRDVDQGFGWNRRYRIIKGICEGLKYLHMRSRPVNHLDLKPDNILLDNNMVPKIADFGLSRLLGEETTKATISAVGTRGYLPPEYVNYQIISKEFDIFSVGVIIIKIITGSAGYSLISDMEPDKFIEHGVTIGSVTTKLLDIYPAQILFPLKPNKLMSRSLELTNRTDEYVAIRLLTKCSKNYMAKMPLCGILPPRSAYTLVVTRSAQKHQLPPNSDDILTLESSIAGEVDVGLNNGNPDIKFSNFFKQAKEAAANKVYEETSLKVVSGPPDARTSAQFLQSEIEIISNRKFLHVLSIDLHPTEPWILTGHHGGDVVIWDYQAQEILNSFDFAQKPVYSVKFIERKQWLIAGDGDGIIYVYNYNTNEEVTNKEDHEGYITSLAVLPTDPLVLSSSDDQCIILWDWEKDWTCTTFKGHSGRVTQVIFNPMDTDSFVSASLDHTIKVWNISSSKCKMTLRDQSNGLLSVHSYTSGNRQYLITGSWDGTAQVWDLEAEKCVRTFKGHVNDLSCVFVHPNLPMVIIGFQDGTVHLWNQNCNQEEQEEVEEDRELGVVRMEEEKVDESEEGVDAGDDVVGVEDKDEAAAKEEVQEEKDRPPSHVSSAPSTIWDTYRLENTIGMNLGAVYAFGYIKSSKRIVIGCHQGIAIMQINSLGRPS